MTNATQTNPADALARLFPVASLADAQRQARALGVTIRRDAAPAGGFEVFNRGARVADLAACATYAETLPEAVALAHVVAIERDSGRVGFGGLSTRSRAEAVGHAALRAHGLTGATVTADPIPGPGPVCVRLVLTAHGQNGPIRYTTTERATLAALAEAADDAAESLAGELADELAAEADELAELADAADNVAEARRAGPPVAGELADAAEVLTLTESEVADALAAVPGSDCVCLICGRAFATGPAGLQICPACYPADRAKAEAEARDRAAGDALAAVERGPAEELAEVLTTAHAFGQAEAARLWAACRLADRLADPDDVAAMLADPFAYDLAAEELAHESARFVAGLPGSLVWPGLPMAARRDVAAMLAAGPVTADRLAGLGLPGDVAARLMPDSLALWPEVTRDALARYPEAEAARLWADLAHVAKLAARMAVGVAEVLASRAGTLAADMPTDLAQCATNAAEAATLAERAELTARRAAWFASLAGIERAGADAMAARLADMRDRYRAKAAKLAARVASYAAEPVAPVALPDPPAVIFTGPTWAGLVPAFAAVLADGTERGRQIARYELARMAEAADRWNAAAKADPATAARLAGLPAGMAARVATLAEIVAAEESGHAGAVAMLAVGSGFMLAAAFAIWPAFGLVAGLGIVGAVLAVTGR